MLIVYAADYVTRKYCLRGGKIVYDITFCQVFRDFSKEIIVEIEKIPLDTSF